ncbi:MAG TPA: TraB/GumN family protein [Caulobacteraceae bacterium]|nr:TraB/GumN family protein [Caulobacteraceae bacterium]
MSALAGLLIWLLAGAASAQPPVWVVHGPHATIVLFGSVHILPPGLDWEPPTLKRALAKASDLWFEIPLDDASSLTAWRLAGKQGMQAPGESLSAQLSPASRGRLAKVAESCGVSVEGLDRLRPWLAEITLSLAVYRQAGALQEDGVERQIAGLVPPAVPRRAFETAEEQIRFLSNAPLSDQIASLEETLGELDDGPASYERVVTVWMDGDAPGIVREALDPMIKSAPGVYRSLVVDRNRRWAAAIRARLQGRGEAVMIVGVGHLVGPGSVPALLRAQGVSVDGP